MQYTWMLPEIKEHENVPLSVSPQSPPAKQSSNAAATSSVHSAEETNNGGISPLLKMKPLQSRG